MKQIFQRTDSTEPRHAAVVVAAAVCWCVVVLGPIHGAAGQEPPSAGVDLSVDQARVADRFERLETVLARLAELTAGTDPRRARLLREAIAKSRDQALNERFETIVSLLEDERLSAAANRQTELQAELDELLTLLLKADRDRELESQHRRIKKYLQEVGRLIRLEKGLRARTEGGDDTKRLAKDQGQVAEQTGELGKAISETERRDAGGDAAKANDSKKAGDASKDGRPSNGKPSDTGESPPSDSGSPSQSKPSKSKPLPGGQPGGQSADSPPSD
jgi:hypothetical protein